MGVARYPPLTSDNDDLQHGESTKTTKRPVPSHNWRQHGAFLDESRQRPTLPGGFPPSTIGAGGLNCRVREGNGCIPAAMATGNLDSRRTLRRGDTEVSTLSHP